MCIWVFNTHSKRQGIWVRTVGPEWRLGDFRDCSSKPDHRLHSRTVKVSSSKHIPCARPHSWFANCSNWSISSLCKFPVRGGWVVESLSFLPKLGVVGFKALGPTVNLALSEADRIWLSVWPWCKMKRAWHSHGKCIWQCLLQRVLDVSLPLCRVQMVLWKQNKNKTVIKYW